MMVLALAWVSYHLQITTLPHWMGGIALAWPLILSTAAAEQVPFNQWRAYGQLKWQNGAIFTIFFLFGPFWAFYFSWCWPWLLMPKAGVVLVLITFGAFTWIKMIRHHQQDIIKDDSLSDLRKNK